MRAHETVGEQVQAQVGVGGVGRRLRQVGDDGRDELLADAARVVAAGLQAPPRARASPSAGAG